MKVVEKGEKEGWIFKSGLVTRPSMVKGILPKDNRLYYGCSCTVVQEQKGRERYQIGLGREIEEQKGTGATGLSEDIRKAENSLTGGGAANRSSLSLSQ